MELPIRLSKDSREPIYHQIENQIKALIAGGQLPTGTPLPSIRALSKDLEVSIITTRRAYQDLERQGFIRTTQGKGTFVAELAEGKKEEVKVSTVYEALEKAIVIGLRHDYTMEQIERMFGQVIIDIEKKRGNKG